MKRILLISLSLVLALVGWSAVGAEDGFYVIPAMRGNYAPVPKTGQTTPYDANIPPKDDGALQKGVASPTPRFTDNSNGTVTDNLTKLVWTKNANTFGVLTWQAALTAAATLKNGTHDLTDGSNQGDWRLPNLRELQSLIDYGQYNPALPNTLGTGQWEEGYPFQGVQSGDYWSATTYASPYVDPTAWCVYFGDGYLHAPPKSSSNYVWCVRGGP
jgi:hypothetical protein